MAPIDHPQPATETAPHLTRGRHRAWVSDMRLFALLAVFVALLGGLRAQTTYPPIPGYDVGLPPHGAYYTTWYRGMPAMILAIPGHSTIATKHDVEFLPPGTQRVSLHVREFWVFDARPCIVGTPVFLQETYPTGIVPLGAMSVAGANAFAHPFELFLASGDPGYSNWRLSYCSPAGCMSRCGAWDREPQLEAYLITIAMK
jgi:hypothetical protein